MTGNELKYIGLAHEQGKFSGDGYFTQRCHDWLKKETGAIQALLTHSCTAALEMAALLVDIREGDEVIMPSYTFVSTANAFLLRGAIPVFVDIRADTLNIDESLIEDAITTRTKVIVPVHYAGVACKMDTIMDIARRHNLIVVEDAAQAIGSNYKGSPLGSIGHLGAYSFHETKNIISGEGGALLINDSSYVDRAHILWEKGTNRRAFYEGKVDKYTWQDIGSSFLPGEIIAAFLWAQMEQAETITKRRLGIWNAYHSAFESLENEGKLRRPIVPVTCEHNAHMYYLILPSIEFRSKLIKVLAEKSINSVFHYVPLHDSPMGQKYHPPVKTLNCTIDMSERILRLPLWLGIEELLPSVICEITSSILGVSEEFNLGK